MNTILAKPTVFATSYGVGISIGIIFTRPQLSATEASKRLPFFIKHGERSIPSCRCHYSPATTPLLADDQSTDSAALGGEYDIRYLSGNNCRGEVARF